MADRGQLPQTHRPQTKQPTATSLLHTHDPKPLDDSHHGRITPRLTTEQAPTTNATGTTGTISTRALSIRALIAGVLNGHQQASQQPLHHTSQHPTGGQGRQQTGRILHQDRRHRRGNPTRHAQHLDRTTSQVTRKHTTFEHTYSIATAPTSHTTNQPPETAAITTNNRETETLPLSARPSPSALHDAPEGTCGR